MERLVNVKEVLDRLNSYPKAGSFLYKESVEAIKENGVVIVDLADTISVPTQFMNTSFGKMMDEYDIDEVKKLYSFKNITRTQLERIRKYFLDYQKAYPKTPPAE